MATLWIEEYEAVGQESGAVVPVANLSSATAQQQIGSLTSTHQESNAFAADTRYLIIHSDVECYIKFGANPTADTASIHLPAGVLRDFTILKGQSWKVSARTP